MTASDSFSRISSKGDGCSGGWRVEGKGLYQTIFKFSPTRKSGILPSSGLSTWIRYSHFIGRKSQMRREQNLWRGAGWSILSSALSVDQTVDLGKKEPGPSEGCSTKTLPLSMILALQNHIMWVLVRNAESQTPTPDLLNQNLLLTRPLVIYVHSRVWEILAGVVGYTVNSKTLKKTMNSFKIMN